MRWGIGLVVVVMLAGCTAPPPVADAPPSPAPTPTTPSLGPEGTVIATGHFDPAEGVTGTIELLVGKAGVTDVRLTGFSSTLPAGAELLLSPYPLTPERTCLDRFAFDLGTVTALDQVVPVGDLGEFGGGDPSFIDGAVIGMYVEAEKARIDCGRSILARASFVWTTPDMRPTLSVVDAGPASGAEGEVTTDGGRPIAYTVADGDVISAIADRFGVTVDDLGFLNPFRGTGMAIADEIINLDRDNRNAPWG